jgi:hypothetical protein
MTVTKICRVCNVEKDIDEFAVRKARGRKDGRRTECKSCTKLYKKDNYIKNVDVIAAKGKVYREANKEILKERKKKYYKDNKVELNKKAKKYYQRDKVAIKKKAVKWNRENKERRKEICSKYTKNNSHKANAMTADRRAKLHNATPEWSESKKITLLYKKAKWLEALTGMKYHVDHVIPLKGKEVCGLHVWANLQILEASINIKKSNKVDKYNK